MNLPNKNTPEASDEELFKLRKAVEASGEVIFLTDRTGVITSINPEFKRVYGYTAEEVVNKKTPRILKSGVMEPEFYEKFWENLLNKQIVRGEIINKCKDGRLITIEGSANPILDENGEVIGFLAIQRDITRRKHAEEEIRRRNKELSALYAISSTVSQSLDLTQILRTSIDEVLSLDFLAKDAHCLLFLLEENRNELTLAAHRGVPSYHPCLAVPPALGECLCGWVVENGEPIIAHHGGEDRRHTRCIPEMEDHMDICLPLKARGNILGTMNLRLPPEVEVNKGDLSFLMSVVEQISVAIENAQLFKDISIQHKRLRDLTSRLAEVEEIERRQLAQELHDQVGQNLTALGVNLNIIRSEVGAGYNEKINSCLSESLAIVELTTERIRDLMGDLRPPILDDYGLLATLHWYGNQFAARVGLVIEVQGEDPTPELTSSVETTLFKITQEALTNVAKHAGASHVSISLATDNNRMRLEIADDGIGFHPDKDLHSDEKKGWGLLIMAERTEAIGGRFDVESLPTYQGCRIIVEIDR
jgi:PAS domain S-box-containing protein